MLNPILVQTPLILPNLVKFFRKQKYEYTLKKFSSTLNPILVQTPLISPKFGELKLQSYFGASVAP